jgi:hypothetical protein
MKVSILSAFVALYATSALAGLEDAKYSVRPSLLEPLVCVTRPLLLLADLVNPLIAACRLSLSRLRSSSTQSRPSVAL